MIKRRIIFLTLSFLFASQTNSQVLYKTDISKGTKSIRGKYYNGSGGKGYWDLRKLDPTGRTTIVKKYKRRKLLSETATSYDSRNNEVLSVSLFSINSPDRIDTNWVKKYKYSGNTITEEITKYSDKDSTIILLKSILDDTMFVYSEITYRSEHNKSWQHKTEHTIIKDENSLTTKWVKEDEKRKITTEFEYYANGKLKRRVIYRDPEDKLKGVYTGGPGSDDQSWEYKYDKKGRVKVCYTIVKGKKYKIATYKYN